ncbi:MAG: hypothetical protein EBT76_03240, partial [Microbacteriaceae bacterium]|nr:hypothetical protein [Microbacteriaceae bacterium]
MTSLSIKISLKPVTGSVTIFAVGSENDGASFLGSAKGNPLLKAVNLKALNFSGTAETSTRLGLGSATVGLIGVGKGITGANQARDIGGAIGRA